MVIESIHIFWGIIIGLGATLVMDIWLVFRKYILKRPALNYCFIGRWMLHMPEGIFTHDTIATARSKAGECVLGRLAHYGIGAVFGLMLVLLVSPAWLEQPTLWPALLWGVVTVAAPFFIMQPAFGFGIAASKLPNPTQVRLQNLITHAIYGLGLYLSAQAVVAFL